MPITVASRRPRSSPILTVQPRTLPVGSSLRPRAARFSSRLEWVYNQNSTQMLTSWANKQRQG